jgi:hypothetical protein
MKLKMFASTIVFLVLAATATAVTLEGRCAIKFFGESTLHGFDGQAICQPFTLTSESGTGAGESRIGAGENKTGIGEEEKGKTGIIRQPVVKVLVGRMDTDNSSRDEKMHAMFEEEKYPEIQGLFDDLDPDVILQQWQSDATPGHLEFDLRIREISQKVQAAISDLAVTPEQISFVLKFPLSLASFQLEPPSVLGFIRVDDQVQVEARVFLRRQ